jgi:hypothetical protein
VNAQEIRELFNRHNLPLSRDDVWEVRPGTPVVKHSPLERLAAVIGVEWGPPQILRAEREEAVLIATGKIGDGQPEWSIGEACIGVNYTVSGKQKPYVYAMAEKRAKDRVILKLAGLHGAYSEEESDDFKQGTKPEGPILSSKDIYIDKALRRMEDFESASDLLAWAKTEREKVWPQYGIQAHDADGQQFVHTYMQRKAALEGNEEAAWGTT